MAPGRRFHKYNIDDLKRDLKNHLKLEISYNHAMKRIEAELLWKDDPDVPDYVEGPTVLARDGLFVDNFLQNNPEKIYPEKEWPDPEQHFSGC